MKVKLSQLKSNPFKKEINKGKFDRAQINRLKSNLKELGLMGSIPARKNGKNIEMVSHHHRVQALKEVYDSNYEIEVTLKDYSNEQMLRGMVIENLTQRVDDFKEVNENLKVIQKYLMTVQTLNTHKKLDKKGRINRQEETGSVRQINKWLNKNGEVLSIGTISMHLKIAENLDKELYDRIEKTHYGNASRRTDKDVLSQTQADYLSSIEDKEEQKDLFKALKNTKEERVREQGKLLSKYKKADEELKKKIREGKRDLVIFSDKEDKLVQAKEEKLKEAIGLNETIDLKRAKLNIEHHIEQRQKINHIFGDKLFLQQSPVSELEITYHYYMNWIKKELIPFLKEIEIEIKKKNDKSEIKYYDIIERRFSK